MVVQLSEGEADNLGRTDFVEDPRSFHGWLRHVKQAVDGRLPDSLEVHTEGGFCNPKSSNLREVVHRSWEEEDSGRAAQQADFV